MDINSGIPQIGPYNALNKETTGNAYSGVSILLLRVYHKNTELYTKGAVIHPKITSIDNNYNFFFKVSILEYYKIIINYT